MFICSRRDEAANAGRRPKNHRAQSFDASFPVNLAGTGGALSVVRRWWRRAGRPGRSVGDVLVAAGTTRLRRCLIARTRGAGDFVEPVTRRGSLASGAPCFQGSSETPGWGTGCSLAVGAARWSSTGRTSCRQTSRRPYALRWSFAASARLQRRSLLAPGRRPDPSAHAHSSSCRPVTTAADRWVGPLRVLSVRCRPAERIRSVLALWRRRRRRAEYSRGRDECRSLRRTSGLALAPLNVRRFTRPLFKLPTEDMVFSPWIIRRANADTVGYSF